MHARDGAPFDHPALSGREGHKHILGMDLAAQFGKSCQLPAAICARPAILARAYSSSLSPGMRLKVMSSATRAFWQPAVAKSQTHLGIVCTKSVQVHLELVVSPKNEIENG